MGFIRRHSRSARRIPAVLTGIVLVLSASACPADAPPDEEARLRDLYRGVSSRIDRPAEEVTVPVECFDSGAVKLDVTARLAQFFDREGLVWCSGVTVREYDPDGGVKLELDADNCIVDRKAKCGWLEGEATGRFGRTVLSGTGIFFSYGDEMVRITSNVSITSSDIKFEGVRL